MMALDELYRALKGVVLSMLPPKATGEAEGAKEYGKVDRLGPAEARYKALEEGAVENPKPRAYVSWTWRW